MADMDKEIEKLIVRCLDGELSEDEQLLLNHELIRNPEARRLMEECKRIAELAAAAIGHELGEDRMPLDPLTLPDRTRSQPFRHYHRGWWLVPGAIAAALLAIVVARFPAVAPTPTSVANNSRQHANVVLPRISPAGQQQGVMRTVGTNPAGTSIKRDTGREILGVVGDDGSIYWIEVDRIRTIKRPRRGWAAGEI